MSKPFVVLSSSRSGTNYLLSVFHQLQPEACVLREVFRKGSDSLGDMARLTGQPASELQPLARQDPVTLWETLTQAAADRGVPLALKIFYYHQPPSAPFWHRIVGEARIVHLVRRRLLDTFISLKRAEATGEWMRIGDGPKVSVPPITIDRAELTQFVRLRRRYVEEARARFAEADLHEIAFEDIAAHPDLCARALAPLLGVPVPAGMEIKVRRQNPLPPQATVANYEEVAEFDRDLV